MLPPILFSRAVAGVTPIVGLAFVITPVAAQHTESRQHSAFDALHIEQEHSIRLEANPNQVFPLFAPKGLPHWHSSWRLDVIHEPTDGTVAGTVALTRHEAHEFANVWFVADYDADAKRIRYYNVIPDIEAWEMEIHCVDDGNGGTVTSVAYRVTALSEGANHMVQKFFDNDFKAAIDSWGSKISAYLQRRN